ncbi:MAG: hypothetical protein IJ094_10800 [Bacilli bacterium]|nr:hypothetical protein [Bacilli bacterium]
MVIKTTEIINSKGLSIIESNKLRMNMIKDNLNDLIKLENVFLELEKAILTRDKQEIKNIVSDNLYYEILCEGFEDKIIDTYEKQNNKKHFIDELRRSYIIRGVKGIQFSWTPILNKGVI